MDDKIFKPAPNWLSFLNLFFVIGMTDTRNLTPIKNPATKANRAFTDRDNYFQST